MSGRVDWDAPVAQNRWISKDIEWGSRAYPSWRAKNGWSRSSWRKGVSFLLYIEMESDTSCLVYQSTLSYLTGSIFDSTLATHDHSILEPSQSISPRDPDFCRGPSRPWPNGFPLFVLMDESIPHLLIPHSTASPTSEEARSLQL